ncbi:MAG: YMGG-like glycine zipper-containing protein [Prosthecobacter sp.]
MTAILLPCLSSSCVGPALMAAQQLAQGAIAKRGGGAAEQQKFAKDQTKTQRQAEVGGLVLGAGIGALAGGGWKGAAIGAGVGLLAGHFFGQHVATKKALAQASEANLDACIKESLADNAAVRKRVSSLNSELAAYKKRISVARAQGNGKELAKIKVELNNLNSKVAGEVKTYDAGIGMQKQIVAKVPSSNTKYAKLNSTLRESTGNRDQLESSRRQIASLRDTL